MQYLYDSIIEDNPQLSKDEAMNIFLEFVEHLLRNDIVHLYGAYDKKVDGQAVCMLFLYIMLFQHL